MDFTTKEIASITHRSIRTIESLKYRLHKKMKLDNGASLLAYLRSLM